MYHPTEEEEAMEVDQTTEDTAVESAELEEWEFPTDAKPMLAAVLPTGEVPDVAPPSTWTRLTEAAKRWALITHTNAKGQEVAAAPAARAYEILACSWWPVRWESEVYAIPRTSATDHPTGGILRELDVEFLALLARDFHVLADTEVLTITAAKDAVNTWRGTAAKLTQHPFIRWGESDGGRVRWWDSGDAEGHVVRVDADGWSIATEPDCWFRRTPGVSPCPLPVSGGKVSDLWPHVNVAPADRQMVLAWLLATSLPGDWAGAGMLFVLGPSGSGKSTLMRVLSSAMGGELSSGGQASGSQSDRDIWAVAADGWVWTIDNLSIIPAEESDRLCSIISGRTHSERVLYTSTTAATHVRRPIIATTIGVQVLEEDLIRRMIPIRTAPITHPRSDDYMLGEWLTVWPRVFGALLDLLVAAEACGEPGPEVQLGQLPSWGRIAWALDQISPPGTTESTVDLAKRRRLELSSTGVVDDPFWRAAERMLAARQPWEGTLARFVELVTTFRFHGNDYRAPKGWPTAASLSHRITRHRTGLEAAGWRLEKQPSGTTGRRTHHSAVVWLITAPESDPGGSPYPPPVEF